MEVGLIRKAGLVKDVDFAQTVRQIKRGMLQSKDPGAEGSRSRETVQVRQRLENQSERNRAAQIINKHEQKE